MTETTAPETRPLRRAYWDLMLEFMAARLLEETEALGKYARGEAAELSLAVGMHKVVGEFRGEESVLYSVRNDLQGRCAIVGRLGKCRLERQSDPVLAGEMAGLQYAVLHLAAAYSEHPDHPGLYPW